MVVNFKMSRVKLSYLALIALTLFLTSCSKDDGRKATYPVTGKVLDGSKPLANALVVFHPAGGDGTLKPHGTTDADGNFKLTTYDGNDGAPAGDYKVTIELWLALRPDESATNRLPAKFAKPDTSGFTATVKAEPTDLPAFAIKR